MLQAVIEIQRLKDQAVSGEIELAYLDEGGFSAVHPNRSAWTQRGQCHLIEAKRSKRLNVLAALLSSCQVLSAKYWQTTTADVLVGFVGLLRQQVSKSVTVFLYNASIHKAKSSRSFTQWLSTQGVTLYFYRPTALNSIVSSGCDTRSNTHGWRSDAELPKTWKPMWSTFWTTFGRHTNLIFMAVDLLLFAYRAEFDLYNKDNSMENQKIATLKPRIQVKIKIILNISNHSEDDVRYLVHPVLKIHRDRAIFHPVVAEGSRRLWLFSGLCNPDQDEAGWPERRPWRTCVHFQSAQTPTSFCKKAHGAD